MGDQSRPSEVVQAPVLARLRLESQTSLSSLLRFEFE